jgi:hypothetical protein
MGGACSAFGEGKAVYRVLVGKPGGKKTLEGLRRRWEDLQEVGCGDMD